MSKEAGWIKWLILGAVLVGLLVLVRTLPIDAWVEKLSDRVADMGVLGPIVFGVVYVLGAILFIPGSAITLAVGAVFGIGWGTVIVSLASTTAAGLAFLIARYFARDAVARQMARYPKFAAIDGAIGQGGWKIIAMLRLSPVVPFSLGNYMFGLTAIRFWPYLLASWVFMLPGTFMYVYFGHISREGLASASGGGKSPAQWAMLIVGLVATVAVTVYVTRLARRAIDQQLAGSGDAPPSPNATAASGSAGAVRIAILLLLSGLWLAATAHPAYGLFGKAEPGSREAYAESRGTATFDHAAFDRLLKTHVDADGWVDYRGLTADATELNRYVASLSKARLDTFSRDERLVFLINAYNACTLRLILDHREGGALKSIKDIPGRSRWDARRWRIGGQVWSLNDIEHEQVRPNFIEPRIHFALVCAAVGCPPLRNEAYATARLEEQLDAQARYVHEHAHWFRYAAGDKRVYLTKLYDWYGGDFEQPAGSVLAFAARYSPTLQRALAAGQEPKVKWLDYDWRLNDRRNAPRK